MKENEKLIKTNKEAIDCLKKNKPTSGFYMLQESVDMAIKALEKQVAKKPSFEGDGYDPDGNLVYDTWICPCYEKHYEVDYEEYDYCPSCGQRIDWSDEDE